MRFIALVLFCSIFQGCAMVQEFKGQAPWQVETQKHESAPQYALAKSEDEEEEKRRALEEVRKSWEMAAKEKRQSAKQALIDGKLKNGSSKLKVQEFWGQPDRTEVSGGQIIDWYEDDMAPMFFVYSLKTSKLVRWLVDEITIKKRDEARREAEHERRLREIERKYEARLLDIQIEQAETQQRQGWQNLSNTLNNWNTQNQIDSINRQNRVNECRQRNISNGGIQMPCH